MRKTTATLFVSASLCASACGGDGSDLFDIKPECQGTAIVAYQGTQHQVISKLGIGSKDDGFDLDRDGKPDNKLAAVSSIAQGAIDDAIKNYSIVIPIEFFDLEGAVNDQCVKFAVYLGDYVKDNDNDSEDPYVEGGDCNDHDNMIKPGNPEVAGNFKDDDCDGLADEDAQNMPSTDNMDRDGDGQSIAQGDCDDMNNKVKKGAAEICGDGFDNDCDGVADRTAGTTACSPFDTAVLQDIPLDPLSFVGGEPAIAFRDGTITDGEILIDGVKTKVKLLHAGPSIFSVNIPVTDGIALDLRITGATIEGAMTEVDGAVVIKYGRLGGVIDAKTADTIRGLDVEQIGLKPENSLLDATFANLLGPLLALPKATDEIQLKYPNCRTPDIDVDQDGLEAFCDTDPDNDPKVVDVCIDGDGTEYTDIVAGEITSNCTEAVTATGKLKFVDGISVELNFETSQIKSIKPPI